MTGEQSWADQVPRGRGWQHATGEGTGLECGCTVMDESRDVAAAR